MRDARAFLRGAMADLPVLRPPVIRRSEERDWMLATDLPGLASEESLKVFCECVSARGWRTQRRGDWLLLDNPGALTGAAKPAVKAMEGEAGALVSLLERHPNGEPDDILLRLIAKRAEEGETALENLCRSLHRDFARRLRDGEALPGALLPYLCAAVHTVRGENEP